MEELTRRIFELANQGQFSAALAYYLPTARFDLGGGRMAGGLNREGMSALIDSAIKEYGRPRVRIEDLHVFGPKVFVETSSRFERDDARVVESREIHVLEFEDGKVAIHRIFTNAVAPDRLGGLPETGGGPMGRTDLG
ncbi:MAG TPA: nuclear transport factor 2 family protein [Thermoplasmata archaeon]|nr:nuclear transport factor 2 family protein [Thermoplasmata archaeon]